MKKFSALLGLFCLFLFGALSVSAAPQKELTGSIPIGPDNPRNSEGDFVRLANGDILYVYTHYYGDKGGDNDHAYLASRRSSDGGQTWTGEDELVLPNEGKLNVMSVTLRRLPDGRIALFYLVNETSEDCRPYMRISAEEAKTWRERVELVSQPSFNVVNNDRVEILPDGRILVPVARHQYNSDGTKIDFGKSADVFCLISDDAGKTWREGAKAPASEGVIYQEPGLCALADGRILMYMRTESGSQYFAYSSDGGQSWSQPAPSVLASPRSPALIKRIPGSGNLLAVWNPLLGRPTGWRNRGLVHYGILSPDGSELLGRWFIVDELESDSQAWQYPAILFGDDGTFLTAFFSTKSGIDLYKIAVPRPKSLFNGTDLTGWTPFLTKRKSGEDPNGVFTVHDGMIHVSGAEWGGISTAGEFSDFHMSLEFKWGEKSHAPREERARDTGFLFHASGEDGDFAGIWLWAYEANIVEGGIGDFWLVGNEEEGYTASCDVTVSGDQRLFDPKNGETVTLTKHAQGPFRWSGFDLDWQDVKGFRGRNDIDVPGQWTKLDVVAEGDRAAFYVNGLLVNRVTNLSRTHGRFQLQSEGAEVFYRNITVLE